MAYFYFILAILFLAWLIASLSLYGWHNDDDEEPPRYA